MPTSRLSTATQSPSNADSIERSTTHVLFVVLVAFCGLATWGCAQDVGDIDRTQPDKIEKSIFEGDDEWYFRQTVVDTTPGGRSGVGFDASGRPKQTGRPVWTSQAGSLKRITWEIEEDVLYARATVAPADGLTEGRDGEKHQKKGIVAAFPVESHFDVQRTYNESTGEPSNVLVENQSDRPWYEREYMRVDWSKNLVTTTGSFAFGVGEMTPKQEANHARPMPQTSDERNPYRTRIDDDYIDTVTEFVFNPDLYACMSMFGADSVMQCEGVTAKVRNSFVRIEKETYEPLQYRDEIPLTDNESATPIETARTIQGRDFVEAECTDTVVEKNLEELNRPRDESCSNATFDFYDRFGFIRLNKTTWSEERQTYESGRKQYAARQDIWEASSDDDGERLPLAQREPEPIVYHLNLGFPRDMMEVAELVEEEWNDALVEAVRLAKEYDSKAEVARHLRKNGHEAGQMFVVEKNSCHPGPMTDWLDEYGGEREADRNAPSAIVNSYLEEAEASDRIEALWSLPVEKRRRLCAKLEWATERRGSNEARFTWERYGDLRHRFLSWVDDFNSGGWTGVVYASLDPKTGEMVNPTANIAGRSVEPLANRIADVTQYLNGDLGREEIEDGDHVRRQLDDDRTREQGLRPESVFETRKRPSLSAIEKGTHPDLVDSRDEERSTDPETLGVPPETVHREANRIAEASAAAESVDDGVVDWLEQSKIKERLMSNPMVRDSVEASVAESRGPGKVGGDDAMHQAYLGLMAPGLLEARLERQERMFRRNHVMSRRAGRRMAESIALMMGASEYFKGKPREKIVDFARRLVAYSTLLHEMGHALGLDHNFAASMDPLNYKRAFWELERMKYGCGEIDAPECSDGKLSEKEARTGSAKLAEAVFGEDAPPYINQAEQRVPSAMDYTPSLNRKVGLGRYDRAAINFAYARRVEQWKPEIELPTRFRQKLRRTHYTKLPALFGDPDSAHAGSCTGGTTAECMNRGIDRILDGRRWVKIDRAIERRRELIEHNTALVEGDGEGDPMIDRTVDYEFCTNGREGRFLGCEVHDWGANQVEMLSYEFDRFRLLEPFHRYRGAEIGAQNQLVNQFAGSLVRTLGRADTPFRYDSFYERLDYDVGAFTEDLRAASRMGLNFYAELLTRPEPKRYCRYEEGDLSAENGFAGQALDLEGVFVPADVYRRDGSLRACDESLRVSEEDGELFSYDWSSEYNYRVNRVGTFVDKLVATGRMFQIDANLTFSQFVTDQRATNISYWTEFPDELYELVRGAFLGDYGRFGGGVDADEGNYHAWKMVELFDDGEPAERAPGDLMPPNLKRVYDPSSFDIRMRLIVNALAAYSTWEDEETDFDEYLVVAATESERQNLPDDLSSDERAEFVHPITRRTFVAVRAADGKSISFELVNWANELADKWREAKDRGADDRAEQLRSAMETVVAKLNLIRRARSQLSPEG